MAWLVICTCALRGTKEPQPNLSLHLLTLLINSSKSTDHQRPSCSTAQVGKPCDIIVLTERFYHETSKIKGEAFNQSYNNWQLVLQVSFASVHCVLYRTYSRRTSNTRTWSPTFTLSDSLWSNENRNLSSSTEKWKMENNRKRPFRFGTGDKWWVLRKPRTTIGGFFPRK